MRTEVPTRLDDLDPGLVDRLDLACDRFEAAWRAGARPRIKDYLCEAAETERPTWLRVAPH